MSGQQAEEETGRGHAITNEQMKRIAYIDCNKINCKVPPRLVRIPPNKGSQADHRLDRY